MMHFFRRTFSCIYKPLTFISNKPPSFYELTTVTAPFTTKQEMEDNYFVLKINVG
jgi:hypothetical protein